MAEMTVGPNVAPTGTRAGQFVNVMGAVVSVGLLVGVGIWGYKLVMRDVTGVPVVRAMQGEMRVAPENPGGEIASNVGLSVNDVAAEGGAAAPEDRLVLAPTAPDLPQEDLDVAPLAEAGEVPPTPATPELETETAASLEVDEAAPADQPAARDPNTPLTAEDVLALADQIAAGAAPMTDLQAGEDVPVQVAVNGIAVNPDVISASIPGVSRSLRPMVRPATAPQPVAATQIDPTPAPTTAAPVEASLTGALPSGTKLVQLGAFDSAEIAATEWTRLSGRYPALFDGKTRVIQEAQSGGRTFYRLRAMNYVDLSDARRFCAALSAEGPACIPVVVR